MSFPPQRLVQEVPPPGGFPKLQYGERFPRRGPPSWVMWSVFLSVTAVTFHSVGQAVVQRRALRAEQRRVRLALVPFLQAEQDLVELQFTRQIEAGDALVMRDTHGFDAKFESGQQRHVPPPSEPWRY